MHYTSCFTGYCPQIKDDRQVSIEFAEIKMVGTRSKQYKKMSFDCPDSDNCQHIDHYGCCPLINSAPNHP